MKNRNLKPDKFRSLEAQHSWLGAEKKIIDRVFRP